VTRLHVVGQGDDLIAREATNLVGKRSGPAARLFANAERVPRAVRALYQVARPRAFGQLYERGTIRAAD
ncbi:MAG: hypothetical protein ACREJR_06180, partial [Candidatus Rokuibacteriota bacterium]